MNTYISIVSAVIAFMSVGISLYLYRQSRRDTSYLDIDKHYLDLLKIGLDYPDLREYTKTSLFYKLDDEDDYKKRYNIYAYMCWNLVETIYDRQKDRKGQFKLSETWLPVMLEENRLHYTWYKHNIRLFKAEFQRFVTGELNDITIVKGDIEDLKRLYTNFERDFPQNERKSLEHLQMLMQKKKYKLLLAKHRVFNEVIGYALIYKVEELKILWLDYMAIDEIYQNAGYGTLLFNKILNSEKKGLVGMFLEVEIPDANNPELCKEQERRIKFYERLGSKRLTINYELPTNEGGVPLHLYFKPTSNIRVLPKDQIKDVISSTFNYIHTDVKNRDAIFSRFDESISDEYFE
ncbi:GNAT family N-acetyltransferase [Haloplasma contractile]|uniref:Gcn5-related N-acetyltransferase domain protein n=1 Tax=Haloplasma contractile SSD-17B TaxID=1033810 RepID=U2DTX9_9MOLU|nr:GNAT family N-acetyltransferase [Haloplasma contractile]ERJ11912.1 Gcn5-related N-acetyltransferase domain protein [Haloplasma contractile SSD-17B]